MMNSIAENRPRIGPVQVGVILMALVTAGIHLYYDLYVEDPATPGFWLFLGNVIGFVVLPAALYSPIPLVRRFRRAVRTVLIAQATASVISFLYVYLLILQTSFDRVGLVAKAAEILVIVLLTVDAATNKGEEDERGAGSAVVQLVVGLLLGIGLFVLTIPWISDNSWDYLFLGLL
jgi:hypothetical protein